MAGCFAGGGEGRTAREETVFGKDGYCVDEEDGHCEGRSVRRQKLKMRMRCTIE